MEHIVNKIKVVIWDLDETIWNGTLAEVGGIELRPNIENILRTLNSRGIVNTICSKNYFEKTKQTLIDLGIWDLFVFPRIEFKPKGQIIKDMLSDMYLRADNALFIDDNESNLNEAVFYNPNLNVISADLYTTLLERNLLKGKNDPTLSRLNQYKQLEVKTKARDKESSNEEFLRKSNIRLYLCEYSPKYFDRVSELIERTNQLNFTKNRMSGAELEDCLAKNKTVLCYVMDNFGDYGIAGFYTVSDDTLIHFLFSCRIMNMGVEQFLYDYIGRPTLNVVGDVATTVGGDEKVPDWINVSWVQSFDEFMDNKKQATYRVFATGACDLYHTMSYFDSNDVELIYECNYFKDLERAINVGTEYIRSCFEFTDEQKTYCQKHFANYRAKECFKTDIFNPKNSVVIMSFHDDIEFKVYISKEDSSLKIIRSDSYKHGNTSILNEDGSFMKYEDGENWVKENFNSPEFISKERFEENLLWISDRVEKDTKLVLITAPEIDFYKSRWPKDEEMAERHRQLNSVIRKLCTERPDRFVLVEINEVVKSRDDVTDYLFHLKTSTSYELYKLIHSKISYILKGFPPIKELSTSDKTENTKIMSPIDEAIMRGQHKTDNEVFKNQTWQQFREGLGDKKVVLWGIGTATDVYFDRCPYLPVFFSIDKDEFKIGKPINEFVRINCCQCAENIIKPKSELEKYSDDELVFVICSLLFYEQIATELDAMGYSNYYSLLLMEYNEKVL